MMSRRAAVCAMDLIYRRGFLDVGSAFALMGFFFKRAYEPDVITSLLKQNELHQANSFIQEMHEKRFPTESLEPTDQVKEHTVDDFFLKLMNDLAPNQIASYHLFLI